MKQILLGLLSCLLLTVTKADSLWIETDANGQVGQPQTIKVIFGSYNQYRLQKIDAEFKEVKDFTCWIISPTGKSIPLQFSPSDTAYTATFTPQENGIYVVMLENKQRKVEDWSKSTTKIGITKQHYYARATVKVGSETTIAPQTLSDLTIIQAPESQSGNDITLQVLFHGQPLPNAPLIMRHPAMPEQTFTTDANGKISFHAPRPGRYFALVTLRFNSPGTYKGVHYDTFREKSTRTIVMN